MKFWSKWCSAGVTLLSLAITAQAAPSGAGHYQRCLADSSANPGLALADAEAWAKAGGGVPAQHCAALAFVTLKRYPEAGTRLDKVAGGPDRLDVDFRVALFDQAGNAWLLAG